MKKSQPKKNPGLLARASAPRHPEASRRLAAKVRRDQNGSPAHDDLLGRLGPRALRGGGTGGIAELVQSVRANSSLALLFA